MNLQEEIEKSKEHLGKLWETLMLTEYEQGITSFLSKSKYAIVSLINYHSNPSNETHSDLEAAIFELYGEHCFEEDFQNNCLQWKRLAEKKDYISDGIDAFLIYFTLLEPLVRFYAEVEFVATSNEDKEVYANICSVIEDIEQLIEHGCGTNDNADLIAYSLLTKLRRAIMPSRTDEQDLQEGLEALQVSEESIQFLADKLTDEEDVFQDVVVGDCLLVEAERIVHLQPKLVLLLLEAVDELVHFPIYNSQELSIRDCVLFKLSPYKESIEKCKDLTLKFNIYCSVDEDSKSTTTPEPVADATNSIGHEFPSPLICKLSPKAINIICDELAAFVYGDVKDFKYYMGGEVPQGYKPNTDHLVWKDKVQSLGYFIYLIYLGRVENNKVELIEQNLSKGVKEHVKKIFRIEGSKPISSFGTKTSKEYARCSNHQRIEDAVKMGLLFKS